MILNRRNLLIHGGIATAAPLLSSFPGFATAMTSTTTFQWTVPPGLPAAGTVRNCFIMIPANPKPSKRAVFYQWASYAGGGAWSIPEANNTTTQMFCQLGLYVVGIDQTVPGGPIGGSYGAYRTEAPAFMQYVHATYGVALQPSAFLRSRGGFWGNLAYDIPNFFDRIVGAGNITDGVSYDPVGIAESYTGDTSDPPAVTDFNAVPSVACPTLPSAAGNAQSLRQQNTMNDQAAALAASGVPILFGYGTADTVVLPSTNALTFAVNYAAAGGTHLRLFPVPGGSHGDITTNLYQPLIDFMVADDPEQSFMTQPILFSALASAQNIPGQVQTVVNQQVTVASAGTYLAIARAQLQSLSGAPYWIALTRNGAFLDEQQTGPGTGTQDCIPDIKCVDCASGDVLSCVIYVFGAGTFPLTVNGNVTFLQATKLG